MPVKFSTLKLKDVASTRLGFAFREKIETTSIDSANAHVATIKDVREQTEAGFCSVIGASQLPLINWQGKNPIIATANDVLLPARGSKGGYFRATCIASDDISELPIIASSQFLVIQPNTAVLPEFLCWTLNLPDVQYWISEGTMSQGSNMLMLNKESLGDLVVRVPDLATQQRIVKLNQSWEHEQQLTHALLRNREAMLQGVYQQLFQENI